MLGARFCSRTSGEDLLRCGCVFGGVAASQQAPLASAPDLGRWPEILVATPGRLLELIAVRRWISAKRISYVVLDEADHMLSTGAELLKSLGFHRFSWLFMDFSEIFLEMFGALA